jgi:uncharacterized membrane protein
MQRRLLSSILASACAACTSQPHVPAAALPALPSTDAPQAIPADFMLSTNEPSWQARVENDVVRLTGMQGQRRLTIETNEAVFDGRVVSARDATGTLELRVTERLCMDSMTGVQFPYTGRLQLNGEGAVTGCGGPLP